METLPERRQVVDLVVRREVAEYRTVGGLCECGAIQRSAFPPQVAAPVQYGPGVAALAVHLTHDSETESLCASSCRKVVEHDTLGIRLHGLGDDLSLAATQIPSENFARRLGVRDLPKRWHRGNSVQRDASVWLCGNLVGNGARYKNPLCEPAKEAQLSDLAEQDQRRGYLPLCLGPIARAPRVAIGPENIQGRPRHVRVKQGSHAPADSG